MRGDTEGSGTSSPSPVRTTTGASPQSKGRLSNGSVNGAVTGSGAASHMNGDGPTQLRFTQPTFYGHDREELTRIIIQNLNDLGYNSAAGVLSRESGYDLETPYASAFRIAILQGEWAEAEALLSETYALVENGGGVSIETEHIESSENRAKDIRAARKPNSHLSLAHEADKTEMLFLVRKQKYLELLEQRDLGAALLVLRQELHALNQDESELHALSGLIMCQSAEDLKSQADWDGAKGESRKLLLTNLSRFISPSVMIPEHRMATLLTQTKQFQVQHCLYHNSPNPPSLYTNHSCDRADFPLETICELERHRDEVWFVQFSNDGTRLATAGADKSIVIYETTSFRVVHRLLEHVDAIVYIAWSPDDKRLLSCSKEPSAKIWDTDSGACVRTMHYHDQSVTTGAWSPDGSTFVTGSHDIRRPLTIWSSHSGDGEPLHNFEGLNIRVDDCALGPSRNSSSSDTAADIRDKHPLRLVVADRSGKLHVFDYNRRQRLHQVVLGMVITCINLSREGDELLLNMQNGEIWTMGVDDCEIRQKFRGGKQEEFVIRSCYGGAAETCIISGGEDSRVSIWHRLTGRLLEQLDGHRVGCVNAVAWNAAKPTMFASAGDDHKVRIWHRPLPPHELHLLNETRNQPAVQPSNTKPAPSELLHQHLHTQSHGGPNTNTTTSSSFVSDMSDVQHSQDSRQSQRRAAQEASEQRPPPAWGQPNPALLRR